MASGKTSLQSPLGRAKGLGSAKDGVHHWWVQRLTAVALVPLMLWLVYSIVKLSASGMWYGDVLIWIAEPWNAVLLLVLLPTMLYHAVLGLQVVIEDYVHTNAFKFGLLIAVKCGGFVAAVYGMFIVLKLSLGN